ncbi:MAG TPA: hypothetical protein PLJ04_02830 [Candidatus Saccharibacteria bacterium]|nr:hypothetical protein [Candidatus Saccharibacteria bacterium]
MSYEAIANWHQEHHIPREIQLALGSTGTTGQLELPLSADSDLEQE